MHRIVRTVASALLVIFGATHYVADNFSISIENDLISLGLPLVCLLAGMIVFLHCIQPKFVDWLLSIAVGPRTWSAARGFESDPGLQFHPFLFFAFFLDLWACITAFFLLLSVVSSFGNQNPWLLAAPLFFSLIISIQALWRICRIAFEASLIK